MCEIYPSDCDGPAFYDQRARRARKPHECDGCGGRVKPGEIYTSETFAGERGARPERQRICVACNETRRVFSETHGDELYPLPSYLASSLRDCIAEEPESAPRWQPLLDAMASRRTAT